MGYEVFTGDVAKMLAQLVASLQIANERRQIVEAPQGNFVTPRARGGHTLTLFAIYDLPQNFHAFFTEHLKKIKNVNDVTWTGLYESWKL